MSTSVKDIETMSYPDFVGFIGQKNTPPGGTRTVESWIKMAKIGNTSHVLDLACSTGFSSRSTVRLTNCMAKGIDISAPAIDTATKESRDEGYGDNIQFQVADACHIPFDNQQFSHVLAGSTFGFIQGREQALLECRRVLKTNGLLCIGNFFYTSLPPETLLDEVNMAVGFRPSSSWTYDWWKTFFSNSFSLTLEENDELPVISETEITTLARKFIYESSLPLKLASEELKESCFERLKAIRMVLNEHRKYQRLNVSIWG